MGLVLDLLAQGMNLVVLVVVDLVTDLWAAIRRQRRRRVAVEEDARA